MQESPFLMSKDNSEIRNIFESTNTNNNYSKKKITFIDRIETAQVKKFYWLKNRLID